MVVRLAAHAKGLAEARGSDGENHELLFNITINNSISMTLLKDNPYLMFESVENYN